MVSKTQSYKLLEMSIDNGVRAIDIGAIFTQCTIYEDIMMPVMTAQIQVTDTIGLVEMLPLTGGERVVISYQTSNDDSHPVFYKTFFVNSITDWQLTGHRQASFVLHLVTMPMFHNMNRMIRRSYSATTSDIVKNVCENILKIKDLEVEPTYESQNYVIPNLRPFEVISKMANVTIKANTDDRVADYTFFENSSGHHFKSLQSLSQEQTVQDLRWSDIPGNQHNFDENRIITYKFEKMFNQIENIRNGMYANTQLFYNSNNKQLVEHSTRYGENFNDGKHLEIDGVAMGGALAGAIRLDAHASHMPTFIGYDFDNRRFSVGARTSQMQAFDNYVMTLTTSGNTTQTVGKVVNLSIVSIRDGGNQNPDDEDLSGRWLIWRKKHVLLQDTCSNAIEVRKDCLRN